MLIPIHVKAYEIHWIHEVQFPPQAHKSRASIQKPIDHYSPQWNCDGSMLSLLEEDDEHKTRLRVCKIDPKGNRRPREIFSFPKEEDFTSSDQYVPGSSYSQFNESSSVEMVSWSPTNPNLLVFQYQGKLYYANPQNNRHYTYHLKATYREYPKLITDRYYPIIFGENGSIFKYNGSQKSIYKKDHAWRASNPIYLASLRSTIFELFDPKLDAGIYWKKNSPMVNFPVTAEILPTISPMNTKIAFISNSGSINDASDRKSFQRNQWYIYIAKLKKNNNVTNNTYKLSHSPILLNFQYGYPSLNWKDDNSILYVKEKNSKLYLSIISGKNPEEYQVNFERTILGSKIENLYEIAYNSTKNFIAVSAYRKGYECMNNLKKHYCYQLHHRVFIGKLIDN